MTGSDLCTCGFSACDFAACDCGLLPWLMECGCCSNQRPGNFTKGRKR